MITLIIGTNRPNSNSAKVARTLLKIYQELGCPVETIDLLDLPEGLFSPSAYENPPVAFQPIVDKVLTTAGLHIITPEYNGGFPGVLKFFIDRLPFPESFEKRPVAFVGLAAGRWGGMRPVEQLQQVFSYRNAFIYPERVFLPSVHELLNENGAVSDPDIANFLQKQVEGFILFVRSLKS